MSALLSAITKHTAARAARSSSSRSASLGVMHLRDKTALKVAKKLLGFTFGKQL
jgi:hypothetical protein